MCIAEASFFYFEEAEDSVTARMIAKIYKVFFPKLFQIVIPYSIEPNCDGGRHTGHVGGNRGKPDILEFPRNQFFQNFHKILWPMS